MDLAPRKRFRSDISNSHVKEMFSKNNKPKQKRDGKRMKIDDDDSSKPVAIQHIPSEMLAKAKKPIAKIEREYSKPEHWAKPEQEVKKLSRNQVFETERVNIKNSLADQQAWSRAARTLTTAMNPKQAPTHPIVPDTEEDDPLNQPATSTSRDPVQTVHKNHSRKFLQDFFKMANSIAESEMDRKIKELSKQVVKKKSSKSEFKLIIEP